MVAAMPPLRTGILRAVRERYLSLIKDGLKGNLCHPMVASLPSALPDLVSCGGPFADGGLPPDFTRR